MSIKYCGNKKMRLQPFHHEEYIGNWNWDLKNNKMYWTDEIFRILGYKSKDIIPDVEIFIKHVHPNEREKIKQHFQELKKGKPFNIEHRYYNKLSKNGKKEKWIYNSAKIQTDNNGECIRVYGIMQDITEFKNAEIELMQVNDEMSLLLDNIHTQVWYLKDEKTYGKVNKARADFLGKPKEILENSTLYDSYPKIVADHCVAGNRRVFKTKKQEFTEEWVVNKEEEDRLLMVIKTPKFDEEGKVEYVVCTANDTTEFRETKKELRRHEQQFKALVENAPDCIMRIDRQYRCIYVNPAVEKELGLPAEMFIGKSFNEIDFLKEISSNSKKVFSDVFTCGEQRIDEISLIVGEEIKYFHSTVVPEFGDDGKIASILCISRNITELKKIERALIQEKELLKTTLFSIGEAVITTDTESRIVLLNEVAERLTGWTYEEAHGKHLDMVYRIVNEKTRNICENSVQKILEKDDILKLEKHTVLISREGIERNIAESGEPIKDKDGNILGVVIVFRDITEQLHQEKEVIFLSFHDTLTKVYNRAYFEKEMKRIDYEGEVPLSLIIGDVNGLKLINDAFGHEEGDKTLTAIARIFKDECRKQDIIARVGGDEFAVILPQTSMDEALTITSAIKEQCKKECFGPIQPSIALGIGMKENSYQSCKEIYKKAEDNMYSNKLVESKSLRNSVILSLRKSMEERTNETFKHCQRIRDLSVDLGSIMKLNYKQMNKLELLALLHDIGKIAIPDNILKKTGKLTTDDWIEMKKHCEIGYRIAVASPELASIADAILCHHEHWDGNGYPQGIARKQIPLLSRIISVIDAYDAMTNERHYRKPVSKDEAIEELKRYAGKQFDPDVVKLFLKMIIYNH